MSGPTRADGLSRLLLRISGGTAKRFVSDIAQAEAAVGTKNKVVLLGDAVYVTKEAAKDVPPDFIAASPLFAYGEAKKITRFVDRRIAQVLIDTPTSFAVDAYIGWGRRNRDQVTLLIGGIAKEHGTHVELLVFEKGSVREITERELPELGSKQFVDILRATVQEFGARYALTRTVIADPLCAQLPDIEFAEPIGLRPFVGSMSFPLRTFLKGKLKVDRARVKINRTALWSVTLSATAVSMLISAFMIHQSWGKLEAARLRFARAAALPSIQHSGGISPDLLARMENHRNYLTTPGAQVVEARMMLRLAHAAAAVPHLTIRSIAILPDMQKEPTALPAVPPHAGTPAPAAATAQPKPTARGTPMITLEVACPPDGADMVAQGRDLAVKLSTSSGFPMRIDQGGILSADPRTGVRRWRIEVPYETEAAR
ncbi:hypothetical protein [Noviherbaspirillum pedocola]|uniref:Uncharacterized protein n=1 Tax=Noviherbaspirillum pedocola TaxID=2801341 RepID=A0A934SZR4_9BURK|nr:hypothetical protein [Noviherbaspirillum pedocola]MBK4738753.1 hypothetical protein [Noviherbaspirillum pedocola]